jgi:lysozyme
MDIEQLRVELEEDEGIKYEVYKDHLGYPTFGVGHLVRDDDPEYGMPVGTPVTEERVAEVFEQDIETVLEDCCKLYSDFDDLPEEVQRIVANMMFNLGYPRLSAFRGMRAGVNARDWDKAADEMVDSRWYTQVPNRAKRLVSRMRSV